MRRARTIAAMAATLTATSAAALIAGSTGIAAAATTWTFQAMPQLNGSSLSAISCMSSSSCIAVGDYNRPAERALAGFWDGSTWTLQPAASPSGSTGTVLSGVSCVSATSCMAVGDYGTSAGTVLPLAESWNGSTWTILTTPAPGGAAGSWLTSVSCVAAGCNAVGYSRQSATSTLTLAEHWDGSAWTIVATPSPGPGTGILDAELHAVSCSSANRCTAVGHYRRVNRTLGALAERWNGIHWFVQNTRNPSTSPSALEGVSCPAVNACTAVGSTGAQPANVPLAESWNGSAWAIQPGHAPAGSNGAGLVAVSCVTATACTAVGQYMNQAESTLTLAEHLSGGTWRPQPTAQPSINKVLYGVACLTAIQCTAVGETLATVQHPVVQALAEHSS